MRFRGVSYYQIVLAGILLSIGVIVFAFQYALSHTSLQFVDAFAAENSRELAKTDTFTIANRLNAVSGAVNWVCLSVMNNGQPFLDLKRGPAGCTDGFFQRHRSIRPANNPGIAVDMTLRLPRAVEIEFVVSLGIQLFTLGVILWGMKRAEEQRHAGEAALAELAAQVAHDIRSPLAALDSVVKDIGKLPEDKRGIIRGAVGRIRDIANDLIERNRELKRPARAGAEAADIQLISSLVEPLVSEKRLQFRPRAGIELESPMDESSYGLFARVEPTTFKRALSNVVNNAVEALEGSGKVTVELSRDGACVVVRVRDDGKGIPPEILARLGRRGETHGKSGGSGLGLHHARESAEGWGGSLDIASKVGEGTVVTFRLPQAPAPNWFVSELALGPGSAVVVIDDDASIHQVWQGRLDSLRLKESGIAVFHLSSPADLRAWARRPEAAMAVYLMDYELLGSAETGLSLIAELGLSDRAVLVTSRFEEEAVFEESRRLGVRLLPKGLAGLVPIRVVRALDAVLIDDDKLVQTVWRAQAKAKGKALAVFSSPAEFERAASGVARATAVYVDAHLAGGARGEDFARELSSRGFTRVLLCTGRDPGTFPEMPWLAGIVGKEAPWT